MRFGLPDGMFFAKKQASEGILTRAELGAISSCFTIGGPLDIQVREYWKVETDFCHIS